MDTAHNVRLQDHHIADRILIPVVGNDGSSEELITGDCLAPVASRRGFWVKAVKDEGLDLEVLRGLVPFDVKSARAATPNGTILRGFVVYVK